MPAYRIYYVAGEGYYPQYRVWFWWFCFLDTHGHHACFKTLQAATTFIKEYKAMESVKKSHKIFKYREGVV